MALRNTYITMKRRYRVIVVSCVGTLLALLVLPRQGYPVPNQTMSITPTCTSATTITCADNTTRMNNITTPYNAHSHLDIASTNQNTYTIGNAASGSKAIAIANQFTTAPSIRYSDTLERWQFSNDASTFLDFAKGLQLLVTSNAEATSTSNVLNTLKNVGGFSIGVEDSLVVVCAVRKGSAVAETVSFRLELNNTAVTQSRSVFTANAATGNGMMVIWVGPRAANYTGSLVWLTTTWDGTTETAVVRASDVSNSVPNAAITSLQIDGVNSGNTATYGVSEVKVYRLTGS